MPHHGSLILPPPRPPGGNVRSLAADPRDPRRVYLGTASGVLYRSNDGGVHWQRQAPGFPRRDCSLDNIVVGDRGTVYVGFWEIDGTGGGVARSSDGGRTFTVLKDISGESVRALALAPSDPHTIAAGTLTGVLLSRDGGRGWKRITTAKDQPDIHHIESLAFDPRDPKILYVGTWHLGWKTIDGGANWTPIHRGMIEDSDVMTLNVDPRHAETVYATACTGIYRSTAGAKEWTKLYGIPYSSRRTRAFAQGDEGKLLLAGTTEGLWLSEDEGGAWRRVTNKDLVVNALLFQPDGSILVGSENAGVLRSGDRGRTWTASNDGFSEWFVSSILFDAARERVLIGVRGDPRYGGVFASSSVRGPWEHIGEGLEGRQVLALAALGETLLAGTDDGIFAREPEAKAWARLPISAEAQDQHPHVTALMARAPGRVLAATSRGLLVSQDGGRRFVFRSLGGDAEVQGLAASPGEPDRILAAVHSGLYLSEDGGDTWNPISSELNGLNPHAIAFSPTDPQVVFATTSEGLFRSDDRGSTWNLVSGGVPHTDLSGIAIHPNGRTMYATDFTMGGVFRSLNGGLVWRRMPIDGLASDRIWTLCLDPAAPDQLLVGPCAGGLHLFASPPTAASTTDRPDGSGGLREGMTSP